MKRIVPIVSASLIILAAASASARKVPQPMAGPSTAVTPAIVDAIAEEIERAKVLLRIPGELEPYFIGQKLTEVEVNDVVASLGSTTLKRDRHFVSLDARVRVGKYDFDNSNFVIPNAEFIDGVATIQLPVEATPRITRRAAWLVTDSAYKEALEQMRAKIDTRRSGGTFSNHPSYIPQPPFVQDEPVQVPALESADELEQRAQSISAVFRDQSHIRDSRVAFTSFLERRWYINSEGTSAHDTRRVSGVIIVATGQAEDGQELALYFSRYGHTAADLPGDAELLTEARKLAKDLGALRTAPVIENYTGPVLFEGIGAAGIARETLAPHLGGTPLPEGISASQAKQFGGGLSSRIGLRVISPVLSVIDDPTAKVAGTAALIGGYQVDDEGVPAESVQAIKDGMLTTLLTSRTPSAKLITSNGHARRTAPGGVGGVYHGSTTNLFIRGKGGLPRAGLVRKLLAEAKAQGLPYALVIRRLDDPAVTAAPEMAARELIHLLQTADTEAPPIALLAYKVYPNGKEELVRGVQLGPVQLSAWKNLLAVGNDITVFNYLASGELNIAHKINGVGDGSVPSSGVESSIVTPSLLFKELDVRGSTAGRREKPLVPQPSAR